MRSADDFNREFWRIVREEYGVKAPRTLLVHFGVCVCDVIVWFGIFCTLGRLA